jgi:hypothetical protein
MLRAIIYLYLLLQVLNLLLMSALPSQKLSYVGMIDITASLEVGSLPKGKGLIRNQAVDSLNGSKKKDFSSLESLCGSNPGIVHIVESFLVTFLDQPLTFPQNQLLTLVFPDLLAICLESISQSSSLYGLSSLPQPIIKACDDPCILSPSDKLPSQHVSVENVSQAFNLEALLAELAACKPILLSVTSLQVILQFLVVIHQVFGDS